MIDPTPRLMTRCAHWGFDEHRFWGFGVSSELVGRISLMGLSALSVLGRRLPEECCAVLEDAAASLTMSDPRIWPLKLTRLVAAYGSTVPAAAAGLMINQDAQIGPWVCAYAADGLFELRNELGDRLLEPEAVRAAVDRRLKEKRIFWGFGTPFRASDERLVAFRRCMERRGRSKLDFFCVMNAVTEVVRQLKGIEPNIALGVAAACLDMGLTPAEIGPLSIALTQHMFLANAVEGAQQAPEDLRRLPTEAVTYLGRQRRSLVRSTPTSMVVPRSQSTSGPAGALPKVG